MEEKRITYSNLTSNGANLAKIIATFCVVLVHSYNIFEFAQITDNRLILLGGFRTVANSGVPIFFFLSGYYLMLKDNWCWQYNIKKKARSLLIPYCCFMTLYSILNCIGYLIIPNLFDNFLLFSTVDWFEHIIGYPFISNPLFYEPLWFLRDLFILNLLTILLVPIIRRVPIYILLPVLILLWFSHAPSHAKSSIVFFLFGMKCGMRKEIYIFKKPICFVLIFFIGFALPMVISSDFFEQIAILAMILFILSLSDNILKNTRTSNCIKTIIRFSFPIYLLHLYPMSLVQRTLAMNMNLSMMNGVILYLLLPFMIIFFCVLFICVWKRTLPKVFFVFVGGR